MKKVRAAIVGYGNIGQYVLEALQAAPDFEIAGVVRRAGAENRPAELSEYPVVKNIKELESFMVPYSINSISQEIAIKILSYKEEIFENIEIIKDERNRLYKAFKELENLQKNKIKFYKSQGNFIFARSKYKQQLKDALEEEGIIIRYFKDDSFRITIGKREENDQVLKVISKVIFSMED